MGLLQAIALEALSGYFPGLDPDSLRVNVLKGRVDLKDVVLTPGQVFAIAGFPFRLTRGTVGDLGLHVPWASLYSAPVKVSAHRLELHFEEVCFPESQREVFEAFRNASRRAKNRTLAEGERAESAITRALQKLFPMLLDRVEADISDVKLFLHFITGEQASLTFQEFKVSSSETSRSGTLPNNRGDLAKVISLRGLSVTLSDGAKARIAVGATLIDLGLGLQDGVYGIDLSLPDQITLAIDLSCETFLQHLKMRVSRWKTAAKYRRPHQPSSEDGRAWFQYAVRAICGREDITRSELSVNGCCQAMASFLEYNRLHVLRLRKGDTLSLDEEDRIRVLEDSLDADMILLLRSNARTDVMADDVSAFATKEWLSWVFFDRRMSEEREHLAGEIRKSLSVVERREREEHETGRTSSSRTESIPALSRNWSSAKLSFAMNSFSIRATDSCNEIGSVRFGSSCCRAEVDSAMDAYAIVMTISTFALRDEDRCVCRRGTLCSEVEDDVDAAESPHFLEAKLQKPALGDDISFMLQLAPCTGVADVTRLATYSAVYRMLKAFVLSGRGDCVMPDNSNVKSRPDVNLLPLRLNLDIKVSRLELLVGYGKRAPPFETTQVWFLITLDSGTIIVSDLSNKPRIHGSFSGSIKNSRSIAYQKDMQYAHGGSSMCSTYPMHNGQSFNISTNSSFELSEHRTYSQVKHLDTNLTPAGIRDVLSIVSIAHSHFEQVRINGDFEKSNAVAPKKMNAVGSLKRTHRIELISWRCSVRDEVGGSDPLAAVTFNAGEVHIVLSEGSLRSLTLKEASIAEDLHGGHVRLSTTSRLSFAIHMECVDSPPGGVAEMDITMASAIILLKPESVHSFVTIVLRFVETFKSGMPGMADRKPSTRSPSQFSLNAHAKSRPRTSALVHDIQLRCVCEGSDVLLSCQNMYLVGQGATLSGSVDGLQCRDETELSGIHSVAIENLPSSVPLQPDRRAVSFNLAPNSANVHLHSLKITALRSFVERVVGMHHMLSNSLQSALQFGNTSDAGTIASTGRSEDESRHRSISVQGSDISLRIPLSPHEPDCVRIAASQVTTTVGSDTFVFSLRKASILTNTKSSDDVLISPTAAEEASKSIPECAVMVRGLDLDVSHVFNSVTLSSELAEQRRSEWNVQMLSRAAFFVTASQVRLLQLIPGSLRSTVRTDGGSAPCQALRLTADDGQSHFKRKSALPVFSSFEHFALKLETQAISVELLNDDDRGSVISTIACLELDPIHISLRKAREARGDELETLVTRWSLTSQALRLEDRCFEVPSRLREVITRRNNQRSSDDSHASEDSLRRMPLLTLRGVSRRDRAGVSRSSLEIQVKGIRIVPSPSLYERVMLFFAHSAVKSQPGNHRHSSRLSGGCREREEGTLPRSVDAIQTEAGRPTKVRCLEEDEIPCRKVSLKVSDTVIQIFGKGRRVSESSALVCIGSLKSSLLFAAAGGLLPGSQVRARDVSVSMIWLPAAVVTAEQTVSDVVDDIGLFRMNKQEAFRTRGASATDRVKQDRQHNPMSSFLRHSLTVPRERFRWNFFRQDNDVHQVEEVLHVPSVALRLPTQHSGRLSLLIPKISVDACMKSMISFMHLVTVLDCLPRIDPDAEILLPPIQVSINNVSIRIQAPTAVTDDTEDFGQLKHVVVRLRSTINGVIGRNISGLTARVKLAIDASDEKRGLRDRICSPCEVELECHFSKDISISVRCERLVRITLSPLTARAVAGLVLGVSRKSQKSRNVKRRGTVVPEQHQGKTRNPLDSRTITLSIALRGVSLYCTAEEPRVQLLRLNLRQVTMVGCLPLSRHGEADMDITMQDIALEDTFSWRLYGDNGDNEDSVQWANIVVGMQHVPATSVSSPLNSEQESGLPERVLPVLSCQASWSAPFEHVCAHVKTRGFELNLNMAIVPTLATWAHSLSEAIRSVDSASAPPFDGKLASPNDPLASPGFRIGIDHVVIDPVSLIISTKAPSPRIRESFSRRALMWLMSSESVSGISIRIPQVVFNGDFLDGDRVLERIRSVYASALTSRHVGHQLVLQTPILSRLARVVCTSFLRRRQMSWLGGADMSPKSERSMGFPLQKSLGLLEATITTNEPASTRLQTIPAIQTETRAIGLESRSRRIKTLDPPRSQNGQSSVESLDHESKGLIELSGNEHRNLATSND